MRDNVVHLRKAVSLFFDRELAATFCFIVRPVRGFVLSQGSGFGV